MIGGTAYWRAIRGRRLGAQTSELVGDDAGYADGVGEAF